MRNPLTVKIETWLGGVMILAISASLVGFFIIAVRNFNSDVDVLNSTTAKARVVGSQERMLIDQWLEENGTGISVQDVGYKYILNKFPNRPWIGGK
jgi:hypothetical protein